MTVPCRNCYNRVTGKTLWVYDPGIWKGGMPFNNGFVHHGLWDYDLPAAPKLINLQVNGKLVKVVAQVSKQGFLLCLRPGDRETDQVDRREAPFRNRRCWEKDLRQTTGRRINDG
jgi:glucose dehydrogenase